MESLIAKPDYERISNSVENHSRIRKTQPSTPIKSSDRTGSGLKSKSKDSLHSSLASTVLPTSKSLQSSSLVDGDMTPARRAKLAELENTTIFRQRGELQLLLAELRERDRELNNMVQAHTKQLAAWERDRNTIRNLEERCGQLQGEICSKNDEIRTLTSRIRLAESEDLNKVTALNNSQQQLATMTEQQSHMQMDMEDLQKQIEVITQQHSLSAMEVQELEEKNRSLTRAIMDLNTTIGQFDAREQELITVLKLKDKDMSESCSRISELSSRLQKQETALESSRRAESDLRRTASDWKNKYDHMWKEYDHCKRVLRTSDHKNGEQTAELQRLKQELPAVRKEHILASEREKRRSDMLELEQSRGARMELELSNLRDLCERQQRDLAVLEQNLHNTRDIVNTQQQRILHQRQVDTSSGRSSTHQNKPTLSTSVSRSRSPSSRSPTRLSARSPSRFSSSPDRVGSRTGNMSPSRLRTRSPEVSRSGYRVKSPVNRTASPDRYYDSYSTSVHHPSKEDNNRRIPEMNSTGYYTKLYKSSSKHDQPLIFKVDTTEDVKQELPYRSYSSDLSPDKYKSQGWSTTKALSHAADDIINKYYPLKDMALPEPKSTKLKENSDQGSQVSTPRVSKETEVHSMGQSYDQVDQTVNTKQSDSESQHSEQGSRHSNQGSIKSHHSNQGSVLSHCSNQGSVRSHHSNQGLVHSYHSNQELEHSPHSNQGSEYSHHSNQGSVHSHHSGGESVQSAGSHHTDTGSVHSGQKREETGSRHSSHRDEDLNLSTSSSDLLYGHGTHALHTPQSQNDRPQPALDQLSEENPPKDDQTSVHSSSTTPRSRPFSEKTEEREGSVRSEARSDIVHSSTGKPPVLQMNGGEEVDDFFACTKPQASKPDTMLKQDRDQAETGELDLEDILAESRGVAEQLEWSSEASGTPRTQNGQAEFYEELQE